MKRTNFPQPDEYKEPFNPVIFIISILTICFSVGFVLTYLTEYPMKTENEIKTKVLNEVIERLKKQIITEPECAEDDSYNNGVENCISIAQSLLPKEEPEKGKPLTENKTKGNLKPETPNERQCPPPPPKKTELKEITPVIVNPRLVKQGGFIHTATPEMQEQFVKANPEMKTESDEVKDDSECDKALKLSAELWNEFLKLEVIHPDDIPETRRDIHNIQNRLLARQNRKPEPTQEIKAGDEVEARDYVDRENEWNNDLFYMGVKTKQGLFVCEDSDGNIYPFDEIRKVQPTKTQEEMDREKVLEILLRYSFDLKYSAESAIQEAINYGRKTKQN